MPQSIDSAAIQVCVPKTEVFQQYREEVLSLAGAITFKCPDDEFLGHRSRFLETSLNLLDADFARELAPLRPQLTDGFASFSCDLGPNCRQWSLGQSENGYPRYLPESGVADLDELVDLASANAAHLRGCFGGVLKVENLNYFPTGAYEIVCEPEAMRRILAAADAELLLDIGHAVISAHNLGIEVEEYVDRLPLERVSEVHLSRPGIVGGIWEDTHALPGDREFALLEQITRRAPVRFVTMEYYREDGFVAGQRLLYDWCLQWSQQRADSASMSADQALLLAQYEALTRPDYWPVDVAGLAGYLQEQLNGDPCAVCDGVVGRWRRLDFDSQVFALPMGRIDWVAAADLAAAGRVEMLQRLVADADAQGVEQLSFRLSALDVPLLQACEAAGFRTMTVFTGLARRVADESAQPLAATLRPVQEGDLEDLRAITDEAFAEGTRFHLDHGLAAGAQRLHRRWVENCVNGQAADQVIVAADGAGVIGYITGQVDLRAEQMLGQPRGSIGLFAVRRAALGKGIGAALLAAILAYFADCGVEWVEVGTEATNNAAINTYTRAGFKVVQSCVTLHRWRPQA